jgi:acyl-coenzyme A synthetase/AMP-(fatty) acid ligase
VAGHKQLRGGVRWVDEVPKSASGKILRRVLKEWLKKEEEGEKVKAKL